MVEVIYLRELAKGLLHRLRKTVETVRKKFESSNPRTALDSSKVAVETNGLYCKTAESNLPPRAVTVY